MSAQPLPQRRGLLAALTAQLSSYLLEPLEQSPAATEIAALRPHPVVAVVSAAPRSGASTVARLLAAELAARGDGAAVVCGGGPARRGAPPAARAAARLTVALQGAAAQPRAAGRLCLVEGQAEQIVAAARYLAPLVLDVAPDGSAARAARAADRTVIVAGATAEPALAGAVRLVLGGRALTAVNRVAERGAWEGRADVFIPDARLAARAALLGTRALGPLGSAVQQLADALELECG